MNQSRGSKLDGCKRGLALSFAAVLATGLFVVDPARAGQGVINVNQHKTVPYTPEFCPDPPPPEGCDSCEAPTTGCAEGQPLPENYLGQSAFVEVNAYHVGTECKFAMVRCKYNPYSRPKLISSDDGGMNPTDAMPHMQLISGLPVGQFHYDWWDKCLSEYAKSNFVLPRSLPETPFPDDEDCGGIWPTSSQEMIEWIGNPAHNVVSVDATTLLQNGWLHRNAASSPRKLRWKVWDWNRDCDPGQPGTQLCFHDDFKRLIGFGYMGALAADSRLQIVPYMQALRKYNINLTRVWAIEMWTALRNPEGVSPFPRDDYDLYHLFEDNSTFYERLRQFAQAAADRGIVVQFSLFDKHGLIYHNANYRYNDSPYRDLNNNTVWPYPDPEWLENTIPNGTGCGRTEAEDPHSGPPSDLAEPSDCQPLLSFIEDLNMAGVHERFIRRTAEEVAGIGNVMFEIINEAIAPGWPAGEVGDWGATAPAPYGTKNQRWQNDMAKELRLGLPLSGVARDAFNGDPDGTNLGLKVSDVEAASWIMPTFGAKVKVATTETGGLGPARTLGYVTSSQEQTFMVGTLPIATGQTWTKLHVRADLECVEGQLRLGTKTQLTGDGGDQVYVDFTCPDAGSELPWSLVRLYKKVGPQTTYLAGIVLDDYSGFHNIRLTIENNGGTYSAKVYVDGALETGTIGLGSMAGFPYAYFSGWVPGQIPPIPPYPEDAGKVDNFEAAVFCDDEARGCQP